MCSRCCLGLCRIAASFSAAVRCQGSPGFTRLCADRRKRLIPQGRAEQAPRRGEVAKSRFGVAVPPRNVPLGGCSQQQGPFPAPSEKSRGWRGASLTLFMPPQAWRLGYSRIRATGTAPPTRGVRGRQERLRRAAPGRPSAMPSGLPAAPEGATHGHVPRQTRAQVKRRAGQAAGSGSGLLPVPGITSQRPAGAGA